MKQILEQLEESCEDFEMRLHSFLVYITCKNRKNVQ
jgi:hypothetical protein